MAINKTRLNRYLARMRELKSNVSDASFYDIVRAKIMDLIARGQLDTDELEFLVREVERIFNSDFAGFVQDVKITYNDTLELVNELYDDLGIDISREFDVVRAVEETNDLQLGEYSEQMKREIARKIRDGNIAGKSVRELGEDLTQLGGKAKHYAETLATTGIQRYSQASKNHKAEIAGVFAYEYAGVLRETTRPFCRVLLTHIYHIDDLKKFRNGNLEPVTINCGGWNCIHALEPDPTATEEDIVKGPLQEIFGDAGTLVIYPSEEE